jgi:hypothetical protein
VNSDKHTCVCSICGQGFTRNSSATRHNINLHSGQGIIVKPYNYIIGRLRGEFSQGDPSIYRRNLKNRTHNNFRPFSEIDADTWERVPRPPKVQRLTDPPNRPLYLSTPISQPNQELFYGSNEFLARKSKLQELQTLLYRNYPPQIAGQILAGITYLANEPNNDAFLDSALMLQRARFGGA